jgi:hypothetical protein
VVDSTKLPGSEYRSMVMLNIVATMAVSNAMEVSDNARSPGRKSPFELWAAAGSSTTTRGA